MGANVYLKPSLTLTIPNSTVSIDLDPGTNPFGSEDVSITVGTNNSNGYRLYVSTVDNSTRLVNTVDSTEYIDTLPSTGEESCASGCTQSDFPVNHWGYKLNSGNYLPFTSGTLVSSSSGPVNDNTTTMTIGAKVDYTKSSGTYLTNLQFNVIPQVSQYYMQDLANNPTLAQQVCKADESTMVMDKRDGHTYAIARLKDGKCWMVQNLRLGENLETITGSMTLTDEDTDIRINDAYNPRTEFVLTNRVTGGMPYKDISDSHVSGNIAHIWDATAYRCQEEYGCYYNFYTATAGIRAEAEEGIEPDTRAITTRNIDATTTICPKGWTLPTSGTATTDPVHISDFTILAAAYNNNNNKLLVNPNSATENINGSSVPGFLLGGGTGVGGLYSFGTYGIYWSRTINSIGTGYCLSVNSENLAPNNSSHRIAGLPVRCLLQE